MSWSRSSGKAPRAWQYGLVVSAGGVGGWAAVAGLAERLGLADGFAAGAARLGDLPQERPEDQTEIPATVAGVVAVILLGEAPGGNPGTKQALELVHGGRGAGAQAVELAGEPVGPEREIGCHHGQFLYCLIDRHASLFP